MEPSSSPGVGSPKSSLDFSFGFDNVSFSDRILLLEIIDEPENNPDPDHKVHGDSMAELASPRTKAMHITSLLLAAMSPFFCKLFSNGMRESKQQHVTLRIKASEEISFMDLLNYMYSNNLPTSPSSLMDLLEIADKFEVTSCLRDCSKTLQLLPMTCEIVSRCFDLPPTLATSSTVQPLIDAATQFLVAHYKDLDRIEEGVLNLPLSGIQAIVSSDDLKVASECVVYDLVLQWARKHYPNMEERRTILKTHLLHLVRFPFMTTTKLIEEVQNCSDIEPEHASKIVIRALHFKAETPHRKQCMAAEEEINGASRQFVKRAYPCRHVKVVEFELPHRQCIVYLDLKKEELAHIFPNGEIRSETFSLGGQELVLVGVCYFDYRYNVHNFWLYLQMVGAAAADFTVDYDIAVRKKPLEGFESWCIGNHTFTARKILKYLLNANWNVFIGDDSPFFINGILHLRADLSIKNDALM